MLSLSLLLLALLLHSHALLSYLRLMQQLVAASWFHVRPFQGFSTFNHLHNLYCTQHYSTASISIQQSSIIKSFSNERKSFKPFLHTASIRMFPTWQSASGPMAIYTVNNTHTSLRPSSFIMRVGIEAGHLSDMRIPTFPTSSEGDNSPAPGSSLFFYIFAHPRRLQWKAERQLQTVPLPEVRSAQRVSHQFLFCGRRSLVKPILVSPLVNHSRVLQHRNEDAVINNTDRPIGLLVVG